MIYTGSGIRTGGKFGSLARLKTGPTAAIAPSAATGRLNPYQWTLRDAERKLAGLPAPTGGTARAGSTREETKTETAPAPAAKRTIGSLARLKKGPAAEIVPTAATGGLTPYQWTLRDAEQKLAGLPAPAGGTVWSGSAREETKTETAPAPTAQYPDVIRSDDKGLNGYQQWLMEEDRRLNGAAEGDAAVRLPGGGNPGWGADAAYLALLREQGRRNPALYSNPNFIAQLSEAERRVREKEGTGPTPADSYGPDRNQRVFNGTLLKTAQDAVNLMGTLAKESAAASYNSAAMDQKAFGNLFGWENADVMRTPF